MVESLYLSEEEIVELKNLLGDELIDIHILWSNLYTPIHIYEWMGLSDIENEDQLTDEDQILITEFILDKFRFWCKYHNIIEE